MPNDPGLEEVQIAIAESHLGGFAEVVTQLERAGLRVEQQLAAIGVVTGRATPARIDGLMRVPGVASVERTRTVRLPPDEQER